MDHCGVSVRGDVLVLHGGSYRRVPQVSYYHGCPGVLRGIDVISFRDDL